jgi:hypothetical protein
VARVGCQLGHVPRTSGFTGTGGCCGETEQEYVKRLFNKVEPKLRAAGHAPIKILADPPSYPAMDVFVAFHCDGSEDPKSRGCSFGFHDQLANAAASKKFGDRWRAEHNAAGYPGGNRATNYTIDIAHYYALRPALNAGAKQGICIEFGFLTNRKDNDWLIENVDRVANALVRTVVAFHGGNLDGLEDDMTVEEFVKELTREGSKTRKAIRELAGMAVNDQLGTPNTAASKGVKELTDRSTKALQDEVLEALQKAVGELHTKLDALARPERPA